MVNYAYSRMCRKYIYGSVERNKFIIFSKYFYLFNNWPDCPLGITDALCKMILYAYLEFMEHAIPQKALKKVSRRR